MRSGKYIRSSLTHYWRTNLAVVLGVATTVAVLTGALLVGDSVRVSLRNLFLLRLGQTSYVIAADSLFPEDLAERLQHNSNFPASLAATAPLITLEGLITHEKSGRRGSNIQVYGVDDRFWQFHGRAAQSDTLQGRTLLVSASLAEEFAAATGDTLLVRVQKPSDVPVDSLHGRKDDLGRSMRFTVGGILTAQELGEFSLRPTQGAVRAVFLPLDQLQGDLQQEARVNTAIVSAQEPVASENEAQQLAAALRNAATLEDYGLTVSPLEGSHDFALRSEKLLIEDPLAAAARAVAENQGLAATSHYSYLATTIRIGRREIPYSMVTAIDPVPNYFSFSPGENTQLPPLWLNQWAANDLRARPGMVVELEYYLWEDGGQLLTDTAKFELRGIVPMRGFAIDKDLAPDYPGITDADTVGDWDPPFPIDLQRVRPKDEAYWDRYRSAPKAFVPLRAGQDLWRSRYGQITGVRFTPPEDTPLLDAMAAYEKNLGSALRPEQAGFTIYPARAEGTTASRGAVNFGEYFFYFSFFLVVSALLITGLFFKLGVEQRLREIGLLQAVGFPREQVARLFLTEGFLLSFIGSVLGLAGAIGYSSLMMYGLRTWWVDAVGTTFLTLQVSFTTLALGGIAGVFAALLTIHWTLRSLRPLSTRNLLAGSLQPLLTAATRTNTIRMLGPASALLALALLVASWMGWLNQVAGFFGSGTLLLISLMSFLSGWLSGGQRQLLAGNGYKGLARLGFRNASWRPGRSLLCIALIASSTFIVVAVDSFRHDDSAPSLDPASGTGGYPLLAETLLPLAFDPNTPEGKEQLNLSDNDLAVLEAVRFTSFRLRPGEDASCLNLYQPRDPKVLAVPPEFHESPRFAFQSSLAETPEEQANPWRLLEREFSDGAIPAIADANSMTYILHLGLGDDFVLTRHSGEQVHFRMVAALSDSIFQSELLVSQENFLQVFPHEQGFRFFLLETPPETAGQVTEVLEAGLSDNGFDITATGERLAAFHRVENTYLSTFQTLGGLGLLLGTVGLAAVLLRNVLERRRELALLRAVGFRPADLAFLVLAENALLLAGGLVSGVVSALLAIAPALLSRGGVPPVLSLGGLLLAVLVTGLAASLLAVRVVLRAPLLPVLRTE
jgi:ABC-type lipoprotein release transport system permease subunit